MLTIYDVLALYGDETKLRVCMRSYGVLCDPPSKCSKCDCALKACVYNGKPALVCSNQMCRSRVYAVVGGLVEGSKFSLKELVLLAYWYVVYWWAFFSAYDTAAKRRRLPPPHREAVPC